MNGGADDLPAVGCVQHDCAQCKALGESHERLFRRCAELESLINSPQTVNFLEAVRTEAAHQVERWGYASDRSKSAENWFWLVGYLCGKALRSATTGDKEKALHHTISSAACLLNWHTAITHDITGAGIGQDADLRAKNPQDALAADHHAGIAREESDLWERVITTFLYGQYAGHSSITSNELLEQCLALPVDQRNPIARMRVCVIMQRLGWFRARVSKAPDGNGVRHRETVFMRPEVAQVPA